MPGDGTAVIPLAVIPVGSTHVCALAGREIIVCRTQGGVFALDNICTHAFARLSEGRLRGTRLICPLHGAAFDVRDGRALGPPAVKPLSIHGVRVIDDLVEITLAPAPPPALVPPAAPAP